MQGLLGLDFKVAHHRLRQVLGGCLGVAGGLHLGLAQPQARREYRQEAIAAHGFGGHIGKGDQCQCQVIIGREGAVGIDQAQAQRHPADTSAHPVADQ